MARSDTDPARYREAALMTLDQLDWCAEYLRRIHKPRLARQLEINNSTLRQRIDEPEGEAVTPEEPG